MAIKNHIINALPLIANVLGRKYGVKVHIGGERAYTNGKDIHLPALPLDSDETVLNIARGYLDHEAAHLRLTNFDAVKDASLSSLEQHIWNTLEDFMVERKLGELYPGCNHNFKWLIKYVFLNEDDEQEENYNPAMDIFNWLLLTVRGFAVPELTSKILPLSEKIEDHYPELLKTINPLVREIPMICTNTGACIRQSRKIMEAIQKYAADNKNESQKHEAGENNQHQEEKISQQEKISRAHSQPATSPETEGGSVRESLHKSEIVNNASPSENLQELLQKPQDIKGMDFGERLENLLQGCSQSSGNNLAVAVIGENNCSALTSDEIAQIKRSTTGLRSRLQGLLYASCAVLNRIGRTGRVDPKLMARLATHDPKIFIRKGERQGINTAVHILLDASFSMAGEKIRLASQACYAVASALISVPGVTVAVTSFPAGFVFENEELSSNTVCPILTAKQRLHSRFNVMANGNTPLAEALWWVMQQMQTQIENRKIILILSDGLPDNIEGTKNIIALHQKHGHEIYGIGIITEAMNRLLPKKYCRSLYDLEDLAAVMFDMLHESLVKSNGGNNEDAA